MCPDTPNMPNILFTTPQERIPYTSTISSKLPTMWLRNILTLPFRGKCRSQLADFVVQQRHCWPKDKWCFNILRTKEADLYEALINPENRFSRPVSYLILLCNGNA